MIGQPCLALLCQVAFKCTSIGPSDECDEFCFVSHPLLSKNLGKIGVESPQIEGHDLKLLVEVPMRFSMNSRW